MERLENYISAAISNESAIVASAQSSTRNSALNRSAFELGTIPGMTTETAISALMLAAGANGYLKEHGVAAARKVIESGLRNGQSNPRQLQYRDQHSPSRKETAAAPAATIPAPSSGSPNSHIPIKTAPDSAGKPIFHAWGNEGPPVRSDEKRRHVYHRESQPVRIKIMSHGGGAVNWYRVRDGEAFGWQARKPEGFQDVPYLGAADPFDQEVIDDDLYWPEGEKDADTVIRLGALAVTFGGTGDGLPNGCESYLKGRSVVILADNDEGGRAHAEKKAALIHPVARSVRVVHFSELHEKGDVSDWIATGKGIHDLQGRVDETPMWIPSIVATTVPVAGKRRLISHRASDLKPEKLVWVWPGRIPEGKLVLLGGPPGLGKSQLTAFMSAVVSNGGAWPCGEGSTLQGDVIFMSAEDGIQDTIIPRLMAAGANTTRVHIVAAATKPDGTGRKTFSLKTDVDLLEAMAKEIGCVRLIIVDPISAYMGGSDGNGNVETREVLEPLADMANRLRIAVVAVTHLNKGGSGGNQSALNRFAGSIAFVAAARAAFAVIEDPEDDERRLLLQAKNNLGAKCKGLAFRMEQRLIEGDILSSNIFFESDHVSQSIDEALTASESRGSAGGGQTSKDDATEFLNEVLAQGPRDVLEVESLARAATLLAGDKPLRQNKAFRDARKDLGVVASREGFGPGARYVLSLPDAPCAPKNIMCAPSGDRAHMANPGAHGGNGAGE
jgi:putative DNA primase/helicase